MRETDYLCLFVYRFPVDPGDARERLHGTVALLGVGGGGMVVNARAEGLNDVFYCVLLTSVIKWIYSTAVSARALLLGCAILRSGRRATNFRLINFDIAHLFRADTTVRQ